MDFFQYNEGRQGQCQEPKNNSVVKKFNWGNGGNAGGSSVFLLVEEEERRIWVLWIWKCQMKQNIVVLTSKVHD